MFVLSVYSGSQDAHTNTLTQKQTTNTHRARDRFVWETWFISFSFPGEPLQHTRWGVKRDHSCWRGVGVNVGRMGRMSLSGGGGGDTVGTVDTPNQKPDPASVPSLLASLCHQGNSRRDLGSTGVKPAKPPYTTHTHTHRLSHTHWVAAPSGSTVHPLTFQQWERYGGVSSPGFGCVA